MNALHNQPDENPKNQTASPAGELALSRSGEKQYDFKRMVTMFPEDWMALNPALKLVRNTHRYLIDGDFLLPVDILDIRFYQRKFKTV